MKKLFLAACVVSLAGCSSGTIQRQQVQIERCTTRSAQLEAQIKESEGRTSFLNAQLRELKGQVQDLESKLQAEQERSEFLAKSNQDLALTVNGELSSKIRDLVAEKDRLSRRLLALQKEKISSNRRQAKKDKLLADLKPKYEALSAAAAAEEALKAKAKEEHAQRVNRAHEDMGVVADVLLEELKAETIKVNQDVEAVNILIKTSLLFQPQQANLTEEGTAMLDKLGRALGSLGPRAIRIEGHSDNAAISRGLFGKFSSHMELSAAQAAAVAGYLHAHSGISPNNLSPVGVGELKPIKSNDTAEGRAANNRLALIISPVKSPS